MNKTIEELLEQIAEQKRQKTAARAAIMECTLAGEFKLAAKSASLYLAAESNEYNFRSQLAAKRGHELVAQASKLLNS